MYKASHVILKCHVVKENWSGYAKDWDWVPMRVKCNFKTSKIRILFIRYYVTVSRANIRA